MIGVDIGATNLLVGTLGDGVVEKRFHQPIEDRSFDSVVQQVCSLIESADLGDLNAIGIAVAGSVDVQTGTVIRAQNLHWDNAPLAQAVSEKLHCPVSIENDVTAAAWGEFQFGAGQSCDSMFAVWIGTGIGGGLILDKQIWRGPLGTGGEFGMAISELNPDIEFRVLEAYASRSGFQRLTANPSLTTEDIVNGFQHDQRMTDLIHLGASRIGTAIANVVTLLSLDTVVLGGGLTESLGQPFVDLIRNRFEADVFPIQLRSCAFHQTQLGPDAALLGAASICSSIN